MEKKKATKKKPAVAKPEKPAPPKKYIFAVGRRKTATARVKLASEGAGQITVNTRQAANYFPTEAMQKAAMEPLAVLGMEKAFDAVILVSGGGIHSQAQAVALGLARALVLRDPAAKTTLKKHGLMTRDARKKERKKPGLKRARRAPQWQKR